MSRFMSSLAFGAALFLAPVGAFTAAPALAAPAAADMVVYGGAHAEAAMARALEPQIGTGQVHVEFDNRALEVRAWGEGVQGLKVENLFFAPVSGRFAAEFVVPGSSPAVRVPVSGRAWGVMQVPVLSRRVAPGDTIGPDDIIMTDVRADQTGADTANSEVQLVGMVPRRGIAVGQPVRLRDVQTPRVVDKGALVTISLVSNAIQLTAQGKALQDGGRGDVIRVVNTQSNRIIEATVAGPNHVSVAKPVTPALTQ
ncbi:flagella basal body P-ring formation protein FlgA [Azospirillum fermentarium]|uniref:flagellar basal body P-ring formation chaperone FlgA n=1 Tax=Azospirillum fermentarium TaxID=1233114 RepID=UPI0022265095|nr:flagellar basal body P-ring formation chaperone FlgA [Azospirillum fermentarium]MCW2247091.1 flagella basal body P-ring formation protein FlgA [Azospirillum fermentarium]